MTTKELRVLVAAIIWVTRPQTESAMRSALVDANSLIALVEEETMERTLIAASRPRGGLIHDP